ncbi:PP2C family protein-serine/threonine phosphatase [Achromobacter xylosoxidans]
MQIFSLSDAGPRAENQDSLCVERLAQRLFAAVADGVGGNNGGQQASKLAIEVLVAGFRAGAELDTTIEEAHASLLEMAAASPALSGMASTLTAVQIQGTSLIGVHVGDSRAYVLRRRGLKQLTLDHTEVAKLLAAGRLTKEEAATYPRRNILSSALGIPREFKFQTFQFELEKNDRVLLMTDGIYSLVNKGEIQRLSEQSLVLQDLCNAVLSLVKDRGPTDNFSLVGLQFDEFT